MELAREEHEEEVKTTRERTLKGPHGDITIRKQGNVIYGKPRGQNKETTGDRRRRKREGTE